MEKHEALSAIGTEFGSYVVHVHVHVFTWVWVFGYRRQLTIGLVNCHETCIALVYSVILRALIFLTICSIAFQDNHLYVCVFSLPLIDKKSNCGGPSGRSVRKSNASYLAAATRAGQRIDEEREKRAEINSSSEGMWLQ